MNSMIARLAVTAMALLSGTHVAAESLLVFKGIELGQSKADAMKLHKLHCTTKGVEPYDEVCKFPRGVTFAEVPMKTGSVNIVGGKVNSIHATFDRNRYHTVIDALQNKYGGASCQGGRLARCSWSLPGDSFILLQRWDHEASLSFSDSRDKALIEERLKASTARTVKDM